MNFTAEYIPYRQTNRFSNLVLDYIEGDSLNDFISHRPDITGIRKAIEEKRKFPFRKILKDQLTAQYKTLNAHQKVTNNISLLGDENTFSVCTAHQPNIFTGPLYFIYKIAHAIKLADILKQQIPECNFVPVYYMGSEDADLDELGSVNAGGKKYQWDTKQKGAVGRMAVDDALLSLIDELNSQLSVLPFGEEIISKLKYTYLKGVSIEQATFTLVDTLFGKYGLVILLPDDEVLKRGFSPIVEKELSEQFSQKAVSDTIARFPGKYKVQAEGRDINLFYLKGDLRERIVANGEGYTINNTDIRFNRQEMIQLLKEHPERLSPNVILRPLYQEMILPNIAFIGGGGEIAYWLELKDLFRAVEVPMPVLILRNSFMFLKKNYITALDKSGLQAGELFDPLNSVIRKIINKETSLKLDLNEEISKLSSVYGSIRKAATDADVTLKDHVTKLELDAHKKIHALEKKMFRSVRKKHEASERQITKLYNKLFPSGGLQERNDNLLEYYAEYGSEFIDTILNSSKGMEHQFAIIPHK